MHSFWHRLNTLLTFFVTVAGGLCLLTAATGLMLLAPTCTTMLRLLAMNTCMSHAQQHGTPTATRASSHAHASAARACIARVARPPPDRASSPGLSYCWCCDCMVHPCADLVHRSNPKVSITMDVKRLVPHMKARDQARVWV